jgi:hypothetical protein
MNLPKIYRQFENYALCLRLTTTRKNSERVSSTPIAIKHQAQTQNKEDQRHFREGIHYPYLDRIANMVDRKQSPQAFWSSLTNAIDTSRESSKPSGEMFWNYLTNTQRNSSFSTATHSSVAAPFFNTLASNEELKDAAVAKPFWDCLMSNSQTPLETTNTAKHEPYTMPVENVHVVDSSSNTLPLHDRERSIPEKRSSVKFSFYRTLENSKTQSSPAEKFFSKVGGNTKQ